MHSEGARARRRLSQQAAGSRECLELVNQARILGVQVAHVNEDHEREWGHQRRDEEEGEPDATE